MQKKQVVRIALLVGVWAYAGAVWASIAHHLIGLPDLTPVAALACALGAAAWTLRPRQAGPTSQRGPVPAEEPTPLP
jgi:hypothetical protein